MKEKAYFSMLPACQECGNFISGKPWIVGLAVEGWQETLKYRVCTEECALATAEAEAEREEVDCTIEYLKQSKQPILIKSQLVLLELETRGIGQQHRVVFLKSKGKAVPMWLSDKGITNL